MEAETTALLTPGDGLPKTPAAGKKPELLEVAPSQQLSFQQPFDTMRTAQVHLRNTTDQTLAFKVKTTAPKMYLVRPNSGILAPHASCDVSGARSGRAGPVCCVQADHTARDSPFSVSATALPLRHRAVAPSPQ